MMMKLRSLVCSFVVVIVVVFFSITKVNAEFYEIVGDGYGNNLQEAIDKVYDGGYIFVIGIVDEGSRDIWISGKDLNIIGVNMNGRVTTLFVNGIYSYEGEVAITNLLIKGLSNFQPVITAFGNKGSLSIDGCIIDTGISGIRAGSEIDLIVTNNIFVVQKQDVSSYGIWVDGDYLPVDNYVIEGNSFDGYQVGINISLSDSLDLVGENLFENVAIPHLDKRIPELSKSEYSNNGIYFLLPSDVGGGVLADKEGIGQIIAEELNGDWKFVVDIDPKKIEWIKEKYVRSTISVGGNSSGIKLEFENTVILDVVRYWGGVLERIRITGTWSSETGKEVIKRILSTLDLNYSNAKG